MARRALGVIDNRFDLFTVRGKDGHHGFHPGRRPSTYSFGSSSLTPSLHGSRSGKRAIGSGEK
jgi:hypothetical protein